MSDHPTRRALAAAVAGAMAVSAAAPAWAAPVFSSTVAVKAAVPRDVVDVRWNRGGAVAGGIVAGLAIGALAGAAARPYYYYDPGYAYPAYGDPYGPPVVYAPPPVYYAPPPRVYGYPPPRGPVRQCWVQTDDRGYGYWQPC